MRQPRYALLSGRRVLAVCHDVDGLYGDPAPRPRPRHELRGCEPRGALARAVTQAIVEGSAPLGTLDAETPDGTWRFDAVRVLGARGDVVTIEAAGPPRRSRDAAEPVPCAHLIPLPGPPPPAAEVTFLGCSPRGALRDALAAGAGSFEDVRYQVLRAGGDLRHEDEAGHVTGWDTARGHHGLLDLTVALPLTGLIPRQTREVWDLFHDHRPPAEPGTWRRFTGPARAVWRHEASLRSHDLPAPAPGATHEIDGRGITDGDALVCAVTEAVHGPGLPLRRPPRTRRGAVRQHPRLAPRRHRPRLPRRHPAARRAPPAHLPGVGRRPRSGGRPRRPRLTADVRERTHDRRRRVTDARSPAG